jgi:hypothetical protein
MKLLISQVLGGVLVLLGASVFLVRLHHAGPYAIPTAGVLLSGVLALLLGLFLLSPSSQRPGIAVPITWLGIAAGPGVLFFALYATMAELEEVISLKALDREGNPADLRLWVVDYEGRPWVVMPGSKSDNHGLEEGPVVMFRNGVDVCVVATQSDDRALVDEIVRIRHQKYLVQRLATMVGLFGETAGAETVTLRLDPCP